MSIFLRIVSLIILLCLILPTACSRWLPEQGTFRDRRADYKSARSLPPLEVPPDLTTSSIDDLMAVPDVTPAGTATYSAYSAERTGSQTIRRERVLWEPQNIRVERDGEQRWLVVRADPEVIWPKAREFLLEQGFLLKVDNPTIGVLETDWLENRADIPQGFIRNLLGKIIDQVYSAGTRDRFRVRLERGEAPKTTEVYITHWGLEEVNQGETFVWQPRPSEPALEAEMLNRLMVYLGVEERRAKTMLAEAPQSPDRAELVRTDTGDASLKILEGFSRAWRRMGIALDQVGFTVEDRNRQEGVYYVRYVDPYEGKEKKPGFFSKIAFWKGDTQIERNQYRINLEPQGALTEVTIQQEDGQPAQSETAYRILSLLYEQLK
jgi:outer membrane protein assembly factor BamC